MVIMVQLFGGWNHQDIAQIGGVCMHTVVGQLGVWLAEVGDMELLLWLGHGWVCSC